MPTIQKLALHLRHVHNLGTHHCGNTCPEALTRCAAYHNLFFCWDYSESLVASFAHQIQSEYYGGNRSVSIKGIALEHFSASDKNIIIIFSQLQTPCCVSLVYVR